MAVLFIPALILAVGFLRPEDWVWRNESFHAVLETVSALVALSVAGLVLMFHRDERVFRIPLAVPMALVAMGVLITLHATIPSGNTSAWLHSVAIFFGGALFATVLIDFGKRASGSNSYPVLMIFLFTVLIGAGSMLFADLLPAMTRNGEPSIIANWLDLNGAALFMLSAVRLTSLHLQRNDRNLQLFAFLSSMLGASALLSGFTVSWDGAWWWCHAVRLAGYCAALAVISRQMIRALIEHEKTRTVLAGISDNTASVISVKDIHGCYLHVNRRFEKLFHISIDEVAGLSDHDVFAEHRADEYGRNDRVVLRRDTLMEFEEPFEHRDGVHTYLSVKFPLHDSVGKPYGVASISTDITDRKAMEQQLRELAHYDDLTGLPNRSFFMEHLDHSLAVARRHNNVVAVLFIDLDRFKYVNDSLGHSIGDHLLVVVADRLSALMRAEDIVARLGGDEFVCLISQVTHRKQAAVVAEKIIAALNQPFVIEGYELTAGGSIGISLFPNDGECADMLIKHADSAMYRAKEQGRSRFEYYEQEITKRVSDRFQMEANLRKAVERDEFELYWQPQFSLHDDKLVGAECLIRWNQPEQGMVSPAEFIPLAEESDLIVPIGAWVMRAALEQAAQWQREGQCFKISINLSPRQIKDSDVGAQLQLLLDQMGVDPAYVQLELTEVGLMEHQESCALRLKQLTDQGVGFAIDDFGTGYSSLTRLKALPINQIKIDRSFVMDIPNDENDIVITRSIIALANQMGMELVAEGVETEYQKQFLADEGCRIGQGYLFSRPLPAADFARKFFPDSQRASR